MSEAACKHLGMNGDINYVSTQCKEDASQLSAALKSVSPYSECPTDKSDIEYKDGQITSGSLDSLVEMLRPGAGKSFTFTFLLCSRLYIKPHELLNKVCKRYFKNYDKVEKTEIKEARERELSDMVALVRILNQWTNMFPYDFRDDRVMALVRSITQRCADEHMSSIRGEVSVMLEKLLEKLTALEHYEETFVDILQVSNVDLLTQGDILTLGLTSVELANQLTIVELHRLSFVGPEEFVQSFVPVSQGQATSSTFKSGISLMHADAKTTRNLEAYADWFNKLSYLVATDIVKGTRSKYRARVMEQWVMTARECFNLGNFNSLMAIISALNMVPITRLKKTWSRTSIACDQQLRQLELCVEPSGNHARYRAALAAAPTDTAVPLLSVTCRDLHFVNQGSPSKLSGNRVNFEKCSLLSRHVNNQLKSRQLCCDDMPAAITRAPHPPVWRFLNDRPTLNENALELTSYRREPPANHHERVRMKQLRAL